MPKITVGRDESDIEEYGEELATAYIGKHVVGEQKEAHTANPLRMDIARPHVMGVLGKRGTGKSYTLGVLSEELKQADEEVKDNLSTLMIDSMGIFWSMKNPNEEDAVLLDRADRYRSLRAGGTRRDFQGEGHTFRPDFRHPAGGPRPGGLGPGLRHRHHGSDGRPAGTDSQLSAGGQGEGL
ncbi:MAG: helicase HerA domain-containing protein, partial [Candidatus Nanohaloarchaea archaeon]